MKADTKLIEKHSDYKNLRLLLGPGECIGVVAIRGAGGERTPFSPMAVAAMLYPTPGLSPVTRKSPLKPYRIGERNECGW